MVQQRAARWVKQEYSMTTSVAAILNNLEWNLLSKRWQFSRLTLFAKFLHQDPPVIRIPQHYLPSTLTHYTQHIHHLHCIPPSTSTTYKRVSFLGQLLIGTIYQITLSRVTLYNISFFP